MLEQYSPIFEAIEASILKLISIILPSFEEIQIKKLIRYKKCVMYSVVYTVSSFGGFDFLN